MPFELELPTLITPSTSSSPSSLAAPSSPNRPPKRRRQEAELEDSCTEPKRECPPSRHPKFGSRLKTGGSSNSASQHPTLVGSVASQDVDASASHDPSPHSLPQDSDSQLPKHPPTNRTEPLLSAANTTCLAPSTSNAVAQAPFSEASIQPTTNDTAIAMSHNPQDLLISSHSQHAQSSRRGRSSASVVEDAPASQSMFSGAHHFDMRDLVHAPNATRVNIVNEESNAYNSVDIRA
jgi:hypothetical protein